MPLTLNTIKPAKGSIKRKKRVGRGDSSGHGKTSTRGTKGQRSRTGSRKGLQRFGMKKMLLNIPKKRGFNSVYGKNQVVNLEDLNIAFKDGAVIDPISLFKAGLISDSKKETKILGNGQLTVKNLRVAGVKLSATAKEAIVKLGGQAS